MSQLHCTFSQLPPAEAAEPFPAPAYCAHLGEKLGVEALLRWIRTVSPLDFCAFLDGSSEEHGRFSWEFVLQRNSRTSLKDTGTLYGGEIYHAELMGATTAHIAAISSRQSNERIFIPLDNNQQNKTSYS